MLRQVHFEDAHEFDANLTLMPFGCFILLTFGRIYSSGWQGGSQEEPKHNLTVNREA